MAVQLAWNDSSMCNFEEALQTYDVSLLQVFFWSYLYVLYLLITSFFLWLKFLNLNIWLHQLSLSPFFFEIFICALPLLSKWIWKQDNRIVVYICYLLKQLVLTWLLLFCTSFLNLTFTKRSSLSLFNFLLYFEKLWYDSSYLFAQRRCFFWMSKILIYCFSFYI